MDATTSFSVAAIRPVLLSAVYPPGEELRWVAGTIRSWDAALVEVTLDDGSTGLGEAGAGIMAAQAVPGIVEALAGYLRDVTVGHPLEVGDLLRAHTAFWARGGICSGVIGAIEIACLDAVAKRAGLPAHSLLGGLVRQSIEAYASGGLGSTFDDVLSFCLAQAECGFGTVKFRAMRDAATTVELLDYVVPRLPAGLRFVLDAVQGSAGSPWSVQDAIAVGSVAARYRVRWYEEPCFATDTAGYAVVRAATGVPVSGVESHATQEEFAALLSADAVDIVQPDVSFVGGAAVLGRIARMAADAHVACVQHTWGSGVTLAANLHTAFATENIDLFEYCRLPNPLRDALLTEPIALDGGRISAPTAPGLGVQLTEEIEARYPFAAGMGHVIG